MPKGKARGRVKVLWNAEAQVHEVLKTGQTNQVHKRVDIDPLISLK